MLLLFKNMSFSFSFGIIPLDSSSASDASQSSMVYLCPSLAPPVTEAKETKIIPKRVTNSITIFHSLPFTIFHSLPFTIFHQILFFFSWGVDVKQLALPQAHLHVWGFSANQEIQRHQRYRHHQQPTLEEVRVSTG